MSYKRFPPWRGHVFVPTSSTRDALAGLSLYTPSLRRGLILRSAAEWMVRRFGPGSLPGRAAAAVPISGSEAGDQIEELLHRELGAFDAMAVHTRRLPHRPGAALLLLREGEPVAFVKVGPDASIEHENRVLRQLDRSGKPLVFAAPAPLGIYTIGETRVAVMSVLLRGPHRPMTRPPLAMVVEDVQRALGRLPRPADLPPHWAPVHGDLSPWNLRIDAEGRLVLFDWEQAGFGPPCADEVYYAAASAALGFPRSSVTGAVAEAVRFWQARLDEPGASKLRKSILRELSGLGRT